MSTLSKKDRMGSLMVDGKVLTCLCGKMWPPIKMLYFETSQEARAEVTSEEYAKIRVWEQACGLRHMDERKCLTCKYVVVDGQEKQKRPSVMSTKAKSTVVHRKKYPKPHKKR